MGQDWKPGAAPASSASSANSGNSVDINSDIVAQGDLVRKLKADKAVKSEIDEAVKKLLGLKADYKATTGQDWKPGSAPPATKSPPPVSGGSTADINEAVKKLLALKASYKTATGQDWKPGAAPPQPKAASPAAGGGESAGDINTSIVAQGDAV